MKFCKKCKKRIYVLECKFCGYLNSATAKSILYKVENEAIKIKNSEAMEYYKYIKSIYGKDVADIMEFIFQ